jgi:hypothetical protein
MPPIDLYPKAVGRVANGEAANKCAACAHSWSSHDVVAARFCTATVVGGFTRSCVCVGAEPPATENDR